MTVCVCFKIQGVCVFQDSRCVCVCERDRESVYVCFKILCECVCLCVFAVDQTHMRCLSLSKVTLTLHLN